MFCRWSNRRRIGLHILVKMIKDAVVVGPRPAVYLSGGLDSAIVLHHLLEKYKGEVHTYTAWFGVDADSLSLSRMVAEHYGTVHREVEVRDIVSKFPEILAAFDRPRWNIWPYFLARAAKGDGVKTVYIGEGGDQHFGGMAETDYLKMWSNLLVYVVPTWRRLHRDVGLDLRMPLMELDWKCTWQFFKPKRKIFLREAYRGVVPDFVLDQAKAAPAFTDYWQLWNLELRELMPDYKPKSIEDIKAILQFLATKAWMKVHKGDFDISG